MVHETACGAIIIKDKKALLVYQQNGFWGFPKGHVEPDETEIETATREVKEETGLDVEIDSGKRLVLEYDIDDLNIHKTVILFIAKPKNDEIIKQEEEIAKLEWIPFEKVEETLTFPEWRAVWREALTKYLGAN